MYKISDIIPNVISNKFNKLNVLYNSTYVCTPDRYINTV